MYQMLSEDDVAVIEAIGQVAVAHLQVLLSKERRAKALRRLTHELHTPLHAITGATRFMRHDLEARRSDQTDVFSQDYISDIESWVGLMRGLLEMPSFSAYRLAT